MDFLIPILIQYGYWGMFISALLAATILPFSSEVVILVLYAAGLNPVALIVYGSIGNILGSMINYGIGRLGKLEWIEKYLHVSTKNVHKTEKFMEGKGAWIGGLLSSIPFIGDVITIVLGYTHANILVSFISIAISKTGRYILLIYSAGIFK